MREWMKLAAGRTLAVGAVILAVLAGSGVLAVRGCRHSAKETVAGASRYQCPMHPEVVSDQPGKCPICHMDLVRAAEGPKARKIVRYRNPMDPKKFSDKPMKDPMGMDYVPVYEDEQAGTGVPGREPIYLSPERQQLIGVKTGLVERKPLARLLRLPGRGTAGKRVDAELLEIDAGTVKRGMRAVLTGPRGQTGEAVVTGVDSRFDALTRSYGVTLEARDGAAWLKPGVYCEVAVTMDFGRRLVVPSDAVLYGGKSQVVFVTDGKGRFEPREVFLGNSGEDLVEVLSGVVVGERVVTSANFLVDSESRFKAALKQF